MSKKVLSVCSVCGNVYDTFEEAYRCCMYEDIERKYKKINNCQFPKELNRSSIILHRFYDYREEQLDTLVKLAYRFDFIELSHEIAKSQAVAKRKANRYLEMYKEDIRQVDKILEGCMLDGEN